MKKILLFALAVAVAFIFTSPGAWAQESDADEFTLEEILVTAEKREVNVQKIPASIQALPGDDLVLQGKVTVSEMLENVPNLIYDDNRGDRGGPLGNITIRGIKRTQDAGGPGPIPSVTSIYVDGVYEGIGYNYDIDRVEVLRGPQGTLYGRSAAGGVIAFHTKDPKLEDLSGNLMTEFGSGDRINAQSAINVPIGDKVALRAAVHYLHQDKAYRFNDEGGENEVKEGRIKALFQPTEQFSALLSLSVTDVTSKTGGWYNRLSPATGPDTIVYQTDHTDVGDAIPEKFEQGSLELNYDLGSSALTYIGAIHSHEAVGLGGSNLARGFYAQDDTTGEPYKTSTHEIRWTSDTESRFSWLVGGNYYKYKYDTKHQVIQNSVLGDEDPATFDAPLFGEWTKGDITDYGIFTEDTFELRDDMRITAGIRYDKTKLNTYMGYDFNLNLKATGASLNPPIMLHFPSEDQEYELNVTDLDNVTYKLRFEYDLTPENMLYALMATGFQPGASYYSVMPTFGPLPTGGFGVTDVYFLPFIYDQEELTSYEVGSKNRFLNDRLQVNGTLFYMDYGGYKEAINILPPDQPPPPKFVILRLPVEMYGLEMDLTWLLTQYDKLTFTAGWLKAEASGYPAIPVPGEPGVTTSPEPFMALKKIPGLPEVTADLTYDHTFLFGNGSSLVPRAELRYTSDYYLIQVTDAQVEVGWLPYVHRDSVTLLNIGATWYSPQDTYSITGYVRNVTDEEYKTLVELPSGPTDPTVEVGDPRTWGIMVNVKF